MRNLSLGIQKKKAGNVFDFLEAESGELGQKRWCYCGEDENGKSRQTDVLGNAGHGAPEAVRRGILLARQSEGPRKCWCRLRVFACPTVISLGTNGSTPFHYLIRRPAFLRLSDPLYRRNRAVRFLSDPPVLPYRDGISKH